MATSLAGCRVGTRGSRGGLEEEPAGIEEIPDASEGGKVDDRICALTNVAARDRVEDPKGKDAVG